MKLSELKTGMRVILKDGSENVVFKDMPYSDEYYANIILDIDNHGIIDLGSYTNDMREADGNYIFDIMKVYIINDNYNVMTRLSDLEDSDYTVLYERKKEKEEPKKLTKKQIEELIIRLEF